MHILINRPRHRKGEWMRFVPLNSAREGSILGKSLIDENGNLLLKEGSILTDRRIEHLLEKGYSSVYINDDYSDDEIEDIIKPEIRNKIAQKIKETFEFFSKDRQVSHKNSRIMYESMEELNNFAKNLVDDLFSKSDIMISMVDIKNMDTYTYAHSVNVAVISLVVGIAAGLGRRELEDLTIGAMLHDVGKIFIPKSILNKPGALTDDEFRQIQEHTIEGYEYLKNCPIKSTSKIIALQHHLNVDGSGYPDHENTGLLHKFSRIVAIADVYDALTSDRSYRRAYSPSEAVEYIMSMASTKFDMDYVKLFVKKIVTYPVGSLVRLSDGKAGVVRSLNEGFPTRPVVEIIEDSRLSGEHIDLMERKNVVIQQIEYDL